MNRSRSPRERLGSACGLLLIGVLALLLAKGLYPTDLPGSREPDFIDNVFDNRGVLWAARLLLVSAAGVLAIGGVFIVVSIAVRMRNKEWLRRAGPFEISEDPMHHNVDEVAFWRQATLASRKEADALRDDHRRLEEMLGRIRDGK